MMERDRLYPFHLKKLARTMKEVVRSDKIQKQYPYLATRELVGGVMIEALTLLREREPMFFEGRYPLFGFYNIAQLLIERLLDGKDLPVEAGDCPVSTNKLVLDLIVSEMTPKMLYPLFAE